MNYITEIGDISVYVKSLIDENKKDFFNKEFFEYLNKEENIREYEEILKKRGFNYINGKREGQNGYGNKYLNKEMMVWIAEKTKKFLQPGQNELPNENEMISETQITTTFSAFANGISQNYQSADPIFFKYKEIRPLINAKKFRETMKPNIKIIKNEQKHFIEQKKPVYNEKFINNIKENNIIKYRVNQIKGAPRQLLYQTDHRKTDLVYTKQSLEVIICKN